MRFQRALICSEGAPGLDRNPGSSRTLDLILALRDAGWLVSCLSLDPQSGERSSHHLGQLGIAVHQGPDDGLPSALTQEHVDVAFMDCWRTSAAVAPLVREHSPDTAIIVDAMDLGFLSETRRRFRPTSPIEDRWGQDWPRELGAYADADGVITGTQEDAQLIDDLLGRNGHARCVPPAADPPQTEVPFAERRGIVFTGNFSHRPTRDALRYLCEEIIPRLDPNVLDRHPVSIVGPGLDDEARSYAPTLANVKMIGWVPSVEPYLDEARVAVAPMLQGGGAPRWEILRSIVRGTPVVTTTVGVHGLGVTSGEHVILADVPGAFARAVGSVLTEHASWERIARKGSEHFAPLHATPVVRARLLDVVRDILIDHNESSVTTAAQWSPAERYDSQRAAVRQVLAQVTEPGCKIAVACRGDEEMVQLDDRIGTHFPQAPEGYFSGFYPVDDEAAVSHLEAVRDRGVDYLVIPAVSFWWLHHYRVFGRYLTEHYHRIHADDDCVVYGLRAHGIEIAPMRSAARDHDRPVIDPACLAPPGQGTASADADAHKSVLVLGACAAGDESLASDLAAILLETKNYAVTQRWSRREGRDVKATIAALSRSVDLDDYDFIVRVESAVLAPDNFLDAILAVHEQLGLATSQPALVPGAHGFEPFATRQLGVIARGFQGEPLFPVMIERRSSDNLQAGTNDSAVIDAVPVLHTTAVVASPYPGAAHPPSSMEHRHRPVIVTAVATATDDLVSCASPQAGSSQTERDHRHLQPPRPSESMSRQSHQTIIAVGAIRGRRRRRRLRRRPLPAFPSATRTCSLFALHASSMPGAQPPRTWAFFWHVARSSCSSTTTTSRTTRCWPNTFAPMPNILTTRSRCLVTRPGHPPCR